MYLILSATDQAKAVTELTKHVHKTTSEVGEQDVGKTTCTGNKHKPLQPLQMYMQWFH